MDFKKKNFSQKHILNKYYFHKNRGVPGEDKIKLELTPKTIIRF